MFQFPVSLKTLKSPKDKAALAALKKGKFTHALSKNTALIYLVFYKNIHLHHSKKNGVFDELSKDLIKTPVLSSIYRFFFICVLFLNCSLASQPAFADTAQYDVAASLISKIVNFVTWPKTFDIDSSKNKPVFCIVDKPGHTKLRKALLANGSLEKSFTIPLNISPTSSFKQCQILFIAKTPKVTLSKLLHQISSSEARLTFSFSDNYARKGVMVNFYTEKHNIRFEVNWKIMKKSKLKLSSRVLKLAKIIE